MDSVLVVDVGFVEEERTEDGLGDEAVDLALVGKVRFVPDGGEEGFENRLIERSEKVEVVGAVCERVSEMLFDAQAKGGSRLTIQRACSIDQGDKQSCRPLRETWEGEGSREE